MEKIAVRCRTVLVALLLLGGFVPAVYAGPAQATTSARSPSALKHDWHSKWEGLLTEAKNEGKVVIFTNIGGQNRAVLTSTFKNRFGLDVEFLVGSRGLELTQRLIAERRAGLYTADAIITGATTFISTMKPEGLLGSIPPFLLMPEVLDRNAWRGGSPFLDKECKLASLIAYYNRYLARHTDMVKENEVTSYRDLLQPRWKGKIVMNDPSISGSANSFISLLVSLWGLEPTKEFLRQLAKQEPAITRDRRLQVEWLARGKYPLSLASSAEPIAQFMIAGSHIAYVKVKEGGSVTASSGVLAIPAHPAHPNALAVFANWLLSKEGMTVFSRAFGQPSSRLDVPLVASPGYLPPEPSESVSVETEQEILQKESLMAVGKEIFAKLLK